jgi:hypothetical protein
MLCRVEDGREHGRLGAAPFATGGYFDLDPIRQDLRFRT